MPPDVMITASFMSIVMEISDQTGFNHVLMVAVAVVGKRLNADAAARVKQAYDLQVLGIHELDQIFHDDINAILVEVAMIAETKQVELQAFALDHALARDVVDDDAAEVGLACLGTQGGELGAVERHHIFILGVLVLESLQHVGTVIKLILRALVAQQRHTLKFLISSRHILWLQEKDYLTLVGL